MPDAWNDGHRAGDPSGDDATILSMEVVDPKRERLKRIGIAGVVLAVLVGLAGVGVVLASGSNKSETVVAAPKSSSTTAVETTSPPPLPAPPATEPAPVPDATAAAPEPVAPTPTFPPATAPVTSPPVIIYAPVAPSTPQAAPPVEETPTTQPPAAASPSYDTLQQCLRYAASRRDSQLEMWRSMRAEVTPGDYYSLGQIDGIRINALNDYQAMVDNCYAAG